MTDSSPPAARRPASLTHFLRHRWTLLLPIVLTGIAAAVVVPNLFVN